MTDNEIIKALDICGHLEACADCPLGCLEGVDKCMHTLLLNALDLINRQNAEIEELRKAKVIFETVDYYAGDYEDALKEIDRLKETISVLKNDLGLYLDNLIKEMTEEKK